MADNILQENNDSLEIIFRNIKYDLSQNIISGTSPPSLKTISIVRSAIVLWKQTNNSNSLEHVYIRPNEYQSSLRLFIYAVDDNIDSLTVSLDSKNELKSILRSMENEVLKFLNRHSRYFISRPERIEERLRDICWTHQGTVNNFLTIARFINNPNYNPEDRLLINCCTCMTERLNEFWMKLTDDTICLIENSLNGCIGAEKLIIFFFTYFAEEREEGHICFKNMTKEMIYKRLMLIALDAKLEIAIQCIWKNFANKAMKKTLLEYAMNFRRNDFSADIMLYLYKQMSRDQIEEICTKMGPSLLKSLHCTAKWHNAFIPAAIYVLRRVDKMSFWDAFEVIIYCWHSNVINFNMYTAIWNNFFYRFKQDVQKYFKILYTKILALSFTHIKPVTLLLRNCSLDKQYLLRDYSIIKMFYHCIKEGTFIDLKKFLEMSTKTKEEIKEFKSRFFKSKSIDLCIDLVISKKYKVLDWFLINYAEENEINNFKMNLPCINNSKIIFRIMMEVTEINDNSLLLSLDEFFSWCFNDNNAKRTCKKDIFDPSNPLFKDPKNIFYENIVEIIKRSNWTLLDIFMEWLFQTIEYETKSWEDRLVCIRIIYTNIINIKWMYNFTGLLQRLLNCCEEAQVNELFYELKNSNELFLMVQVLIQYENYTETDNLLNCCFSSDLKRIFLEKFVLSVDNRLLFDFVKLKNYEQKIERFYSIAKPPKENVILFMEKFRKYFARRMKVNFMIKYKTLWIKNMRNFLKKKHGFKIWRVLLRRAINSLYILMGKTDNELVASSMRVTLRKGIIYAINVRKIERKFRRKSKLLSRKRKRV